MTANLTWSGWGLAALFVLLFAYGLVIFEDKTRLRKSKPVLLAAGIIWLIIGVATYKTAAAVTVGNQLKHTIAEYGEILLFLMVAMSYINILEERQVFKALHSFLVRGGWTYRSLFWLTGSLAFFISPVADNMTTALLMGAVVMAVGRKNENFIAPACVNIVVAANAGGAFSPFGDITTLMVWQAGRVEFSTFFWLFLPSLVTWVVPAIVMAYTISVERATAAAGEPTYQMLRGAKRMMALGIVTIAMAVCGHHFFHYPPVAGMLFGLALGKLFGWWLKINSEEDSPFDVLHHVQKIEWDTLLFFGGIIIAIGGLGYLGQLAWLSTIAYESWGGLSREASITIANIGVGTLSAIIDNIPIMFAVLTMNPEMSQGQWLLVTLTAGVGGSILSIGSAAGVALMGVAREHYTFWTHWRWSRTIVLGYIAGITVHLLVNKHLF